MFLFSSFNQDLTQKIMSTFGLFNDFINNLKHKMKVTQPLPIEGGVV
jgi:hypothetical protein